MSILGKMPPENQIMTLNSEPQPANPLHAQDPAVEIPNKLYFPIREAAHLLGVETYVLRFWEKEFPMFHPGKGGSGHRRYRRKDIELALEIKRLLYQQGFTIEGARKQLKKDAKSKPAAQSSPRKVKQSALPFAEMTSDTIVTKIRKELSDILTLLNNS